MQFEKKEVNALIFLPKKLKTEQMINTHDLPKIIYSTDY
jgi:hypothetical protein